ncbi:MAG: FoF1 ATP synthase subunit gamma [Cyanobium sp. MAG06]|nr:FoF1 ATP synthase subunit gamma [Cyanobium sp. MAG06]
MHIANKESDITAEYTIEPNIHKILENTIVVILATFLKYANAESNTSEHIARMNAMHNATNNAGDMIKDLKLYYNKSRQAAITQEISEIVSGAMGIKK